MSENRAAAEEPPPHVALMQMVTGAWVAQAVTVAAELGLADLVAAEPRSAGELARAAGAHPRALYRLMRALASAGIFAEGEDGRFAATPLSRLLERGPGSMRPMVLHLGERPSRRAWGELRASVETGETAFVRAHGAEVFPYYAAHPESGAVFDEAMTSFSATVAAEVVRAYDFRRFAAIVDVGGGHGYLLSAVLESAGPAARGVLFDQPAVVEGARAALAARGLDGRVRVAGGDFFASVPEGGDAYLLKHIVHDWEDERAAAILANVRRAMAPGATLLLVETVVPPASTPSFATLMDLQMMVMTGGCERTEAEYRELLESSGFELSRVVATESAFSILEAVART